jgi:hypothetical protein
MLTNWQFFGHFVLLSQLFADFPGIRQGALRLLPFIWAKIPDWAGKPG